ncbi:mutS protein homolog 5 isoform X6 [Hydra vulgaris]|uniref:MutS protein homolog 5 isoform X6 n=1 Tax=Hydra vulgaris TaxID=6087 RepID=A0ABM4C6P5_HYDVU
MEVKNDCNLNTRNSQNEDVTGTSLVGNQFSNSPSSFQRCELTSPFCRNNNNMMVDNDCVDYTHERIDLDDALEQIFLSVIMIGSRLGAAYYSSATSIIYMIPDVIETQDLLFLHNPFESCKRRILAINGLSGLSCSSDDDQRIIYFSSILSFDNTSMVSATGSLLKYLDQSRIGIELEVGVQTPILFLKTVTISNLILIEDHVFSALQIFHKELHPSVYKSGSCAKEGLSLFGIMNRTKSQQGSALLRDWFLQPSKDISLIQNRLKAVAFFFNSRNVEIVVALQDALKNTKNILRILSKMKTTSISLNDWQTLYKTLFNAVCIADICKQLPQDIGVVNKICETFTDKLLHIANLMKQIIDFEESLHINHFVVKEGVDSQLDEKKRTFDGIPYLMTQVAHKELNRLTESITKCSVTYLPQLGYLLNIPLTDEMKLSRNYDIDKNLEFKFATDESVYYKSSGTEELDLKVGDIQCEIRDHETTIMHRLQDVILEHTGTLINVVEVSAELDCILALTSAAKEFNFVCPEIVNDVENVTDIKGGRHPLQEMCVNQFVVNDTKISQSEGKMIILTGPNASGKSVYMKQVGIIVYLVHIGSFVPADSAVISIKDGIYTRIHSQESVSIPLSTFMIDLNQISVAVNRATQKSLVIIDEFGKGTASIDGVALLSSTLLYWLQDEINCPSILVSTHFHSIKQLLPSSPIIKYQTMEVIENDGDLIFLYHLKDGYANYSYACYTARSAGIPEDLICRTLKVIEQCQKNEPITKMSLQSPDQIERMNKTAQALIDLDIENSDIIDFLNNIAEYNTTFASNITT